MPIHDFICDDGHVHDALVKVSEIDNQRVCPTCGEPSKRTFLKAPRIDWYGMAMGDNAGPEFLDRFARNHEKKAEKERKCWNEHGDYGPGADTVMPRQPGEKAL